MFQCHPHRFWLKCANLVRSETRRVSGFNPGQVVLHFGLVFIFNFTFVFHLELSSHFFDQTQRFYWFLYGNHPSIQYEHENSIRFRLCSMLFGLQKCGCHRSNPILSIKQRSVLSRRLSSVQICDGSVWQEIGFFGMKPSMCGVRFAGRSRRLSVRPS